jgi:hypothetical protein
MNLGSPITAKGRRKTEEERIREGERKENETRSPLGNVRKSRN